MKAIVIDDEKHFRDMLVELLREAAPHIEILDICPNAEKAFLSIKNNKPDVVFIDVEMPGMSGVELIDKFPNREFEVVFTTSHDKYALKALKQEAAEYLIKPINIIDLLSAIEKVEKKKKRSVQKHTHYNEKEAQLIALHTGDGIAFYDVTTIIRCESETNYTTFYFTGGDKIVITKQFKDVEQMLQPYGFYRPHKSHIINLAHIKKAYKGDGAYIVMKDGSTVPISRQKKEEFWTRFGN
ncbi:MAG: LytTR family DNA-binding domain-containing protein [Candidatus Kapaibacterium sp.]